MTKAKAIVWLLQKLQYAGPSASYIVLKQHILHKANFENVCIAELLYIPQKNLGFIWICKLIATLVHSFYC